MSQKRIADGPIFVVGSPRSGTSILTWCLGQHPNLLAVPESNWMGRLAIDVAVAHRRGSCRGEYAQLHAMELTRDELMREIGRSINQSIIDHRAAYLKHREDNAILDQPLTFDIERDPSEPKTRWVDGTPEYSLGIYGLRKLFPSARFIHIVRDCDKVVASMLHFHRMAEKNLADNEVEGFQKWERYVRAVLAAEEAYGSSIILRLLYHDLIEAPEKSVRRVLEFLGETFSSQCLDPLTSRINSSSVQAGYSIPSALDSDPDVQRARDLWASLQHSPARTAGDPAAAQRIEEQFQQYVDHFHTLDEQYARAQAMIKQLQAELSDRTAWALELDTEMAGKRELILQLQKDLSDRTAWALKLDAELEQKGKVILQLQEEVREHSTWAMGLDKDVAAKHALIAELQNTCTERTKWAFALQAELDRKSAEIKKLHRELGKLKDLKETGR